MLLMTKTKNKFSKFPYLEFNLSNISVNGSKRGCSGFITNKLNGKHVYINTESSIQASYANKILIRTAKNTKDYTGGYNQYTTEENLVNAVMNLLK